MLLCRKIVQQYVYGDINELKSLQEANLQIYTPNTRFWWRLQYLECASSHHHVMSHDSCVTQNMQVWQTRKSCSCAHIWTQCAAQ